MAMDIEEKVEIFLKRKQFKNPFTVDYISKYFPEYSSDTIRAVLNRLVKMRVLFKGAIHTRHIRTVEPNGSVREYDKVVNCYSFKDIRNGLRVLDKKKKEVEPKIKLIGTVKRDGFDTVTVKTDGKCIGIIKGRNGGQQSMKIFDNKTITWHDHAPTIALRISHAKKLISLLNKGIKELSKNTTSNIR